jgi:hypothetical protein
MPDRRSTAGPMKRTRSFEGPATKTKTKKPCKGSNQPSNRFEPLADTGPWVGVAMDAVFDSVLSQSADDPGGGSNIEDVDDVDRRLTFVRLNETIKVLQSQVKDLTTRLDFVLSFLGIPTDKSLSTAAAIGPDVGPTTAVRSYSDVLVGKKTVTSEPSLSAPLRQAVVSAVYTDIRSQERRAANIVVSGLTHDAAISDSEQVVHLVRNELHVSCDVIRSRRLGKPILGRIQPVLVTLKTREQAEHVLSRAKNLRQSTNVTIRHNIYINHDVTPAQAASDYQARCARRARRQIHASVATGGLYAAPLSAPSVWSDPSTVTPFMPSSMDLTSASSGPAPSRTPDQATSSAAPMTSSSLMVSNKGTVPPSLAASSQHPAGSPVRVPSVPSVPSVSPGDVPHTYS